MADLHAFKPGRNGEGDVGVDIVFTGLDFLSLFIEWFALALLIVGALAVAYVAIRSRLKPLDSLD